MILLLSTKDSMLKPLSLLRKRQQRLQLKRRMLRGRRVKTQRKKMEKKGKERERKEMMMTTMELLKWLRLDLVK
jgi:hypothetical protein